MALIKAGTVRVPNEWPVFGVPSQQEALNAAAGLTRLANTAADKHV